MKEKKNSWFKRLQNRWGVSAKRAIIILIVFALTGTTVMFIKEPLLNLLLGDAERNLWYTVIYLIVIFPVYLMFLLLYGYLLGQYEFFKNFVAKSVSRFSKNKKSESA